MESERSFRVFDKLDYDIKYKLNDARYLSCYSKRQLKKGYGTEEYEFIGEIASSSTKLHKLGYLKYSCCIRPVFAARTFRRWRYQEKGYIVCESTHYEHRTEMIILLKDVLLSRMLKASGMAMIILILTYLLW